MAGVVSATHRSKPGDFPAIFTRVSYFVEWIRETIKEPSSVTEIPKYLRMFGSIFNRP
ncbi:unnamed protein product [Protopolystoma xenopodis]|uniref:Peptidase S1 domain-containing protein n=1 Tax=Protopolystoma xenopodis TaxID=117903 RepID=A0A448WKF9_9PLAT|nr:unnamed protein product [Protopolystoma xenopodis]